MLLDQIQRYAETAKAGASLQLMHQKRRSIKAWRIWSPSYTKAASRPAIRFPESRILAEGIYSTLQFGNLSNQTALYLLREMEMTQGYRDLGYDSLREWAYVELASVRSHDTLSRLCGVTLNLVASLDAEPVITSDGEKVDGLSIILQSSPSAAEKLFGMFADSQNGERVQLVEQLITGSSDSARMKQRLGKEPRIGRAPAVFHELAKRNEAGEPMVDIHIYATYSQSKVVESSLSWMLAIQFMPLEDV